MRTRSPIFWLLAIVSTPFILITLIIVFMKLNDLQLSLRGYHVMSTGWELGRMLAKEGGSANECLKFRSPTFDIMTPSRGEHVGMCVREYAELTKDPSACELLMPSSYGMSCIGVAENSQMPCNTNVKPYSVYWRDGERENTVHIRECLTENVKRTELGKQCCEVARVAYLANENDCSSLKNNPIVHDRCLYSLAWKLKEPNYCNDIMNENARAACSVQTKAIREDPSFCPGCVAPLESIDQLEK